MNTNLLSPVTAGATAALLVTLLASAHHPVAATTKAPAPSAQISQGKALISVYRCNGCHAPDLAGKAGFSPSLHRSGILKEYTPAKFVRVLLTGVTANGGHVHPPMPVYGMAMPMPPPGGMHPGGLPPPGGMPGMHHGGMHGPPPPPMKASQAVAIYAYLHTLP